MDSCLFNTPASVSTRWFDGKVAEKVVSFAAVFRDATQRSPERNGCSHWSHIPFLLFWRSIKTTKKVSHAIECEGNHSLRFSGSPMLGLKRRFIFGGNSTRNFAAVYSTGNYLCICLVSVRWSNLCFDLGKTLSFVRESLAITFNLRQNCWDGDTNSPSFLHTPTYFPLPTPSPLSQCCWVLSYVLQ